MRNNKRVGYFSNRVVLEWVTLTLINRFEAVLLRSSDSGYLEWKADTLQEVGIITSVLMPGASKQNPRINERT